MLNKDLRVDYFILAMVIAIFCTWLTGSIYGSIGGFIFGYVLALINEFSKEFG